MLRKTTVLAAAASALLAGGLTVGTAMAAPDRNCPSFSTQEEAQDYFDSIGGSASNNADGLDDNGDGVACENLPRGGSGGSGGGQSDPGTEPTSESNTPSTGGNEDEQGGSSATDDDDSTADTSGSQVEVVPEGSADTGGL